MAKLLVVNTRTGAKGKLLRRGVVEWSEPNRGGRPLARFNVMPGMAHGDERVVEIVETVTGEGAAIRTTSEAWDGADQWVVTKERYTPEPVPVNQEAMIERIRAEAERRIEQGIEINGVRFRCDNRSLARIHSLMVRANRLEATGDSVGIAFKTEGGVSVSLSSAAEVGSMFDKAIGLVELILKRSDALQSGQAAMTDAERATFDETDDTHWTS